MAQRTEKEETEFKALTLCVNNCGLAANPATNNMCQTCFNATSPILKFSAPRSRRSDSSTPGPRGLRAHQDRPTPSQPESTPRTEVNRCSGCRKRVGLTGFRCRCGDLFCADHRYSDRHVCSYDYKAAGRDAIARENPVVKAAKIVKL